jgi:hypothetical protein
MFNVLFHLGAHPAAAIYILYGSSRGGRAAGQEKCTKRMRHFRSLAKLDKLNAVHFDMLIN